MGLTHATNHVEVNVCCLHFLFGLGVRSFCLMRGDSCDVWSGPSLPLHVQEFYMCQLVVMIGGSNCS